MTGFIKESREAFGVEPICETLQFAPSVTRQANCKAILPGGHLL
jgi:hypothetical protein